MKVDHVKIGDVFVTLGALDFYGSLGVASDPRNWHRCSVRWPRCFFVVCDTFEGAGIGGRAHLMIASCHGIAFAEEIWITMSNSYAYEKVCEKQCER